MDVIAQEHTLNYMLLKEKSKMKNKPRKFGERDYNHPLGGLFYILDEAFIPKPKGSLYDDSIKIGKTRHTPISLVLITLLLGFGVCASYICLNNFYKDYIDVNRELLRKDKIQRRECVEELKRLEGVLNAPRDY